MRCVVKLSSLEAEEYPGTSHASKMLGRRSANQCLATYLSARNPTNREQYAVANQTQRSFPEPRAANRRINTPKSREGRVISLLQLQEGEPAPGNCLPHSGADTWRHQPVGGHRPLLCSTSFLGRGEHGLHNSVELCSHEAKEYPGSRTLEGLGEKLGVTLSVFYSMAAYCTKERFTAAYSDRQALFLLQRSCPVAPTSSPIRDRMILVPNQDPISNRQFQRFEMNFISTSELKEVQQFFPCRSWIRSRIEFRTAMAQPGTTRLARLLFTRHPARGRPNNANINNRNGMNELKTRARHTAQVAVAARGRKTSGKDGVSNEHGYRPTVNLYPREINCTAEGRTLLAGGRLGRCRGEGVDAPPPPQRPTERAKKGGLCERRHVGVFFGGQARAGDERVDEHVSVAPSAHRAFAPQARQSPSTRRPRACILTGLAGRYAADKVADNGEKVVTCLDNRYEGEHGAAHRNAKEGGWGVEREILEKTRRPAAPSGTTPTCENPGAIPPGSPRWEVSSLTTKPPRPREVFDRSSSLVTVWICAGTGVEDSASELKRLSNLRQCAQYLREMPLFVGHGHRPHAPRQQNGVKCQQLVTKSSQNCRTCVQHADLPEVHALQTRTERLQTVTHIRTTILKTNPNWLKTDFSKAQYFEVSVVSCCLSALCDSGITVALSTAVQSIELSGDDAPYDRGSIALIESQGYAPQALVRLLASHHASRVRFPAGSLPDYRMWESCRMMPLIGGFSRGSPLHSGAAPYLASPSPALKTSLNPANSLKTPHDRVKRCRDRKINTKASGRDNIDVFTQNKRPSIREQMMKAPLGSVIFLRRGLFNALLRAEATLEGLIETTKELVERTSEPGDCARHLLAWQQD
ncbi:hypothetical protein PR048_032244 [Dryococelus australis]|uniref:Uncharacterized protein n=1 Tax=Dryococelus australis TaxID=614101 RepID=A0ABQ9G5U3_9NEOP|nr:hypothetical protein PR048_032244 [Dryococelus australis]